MEAVCTKGNRVVKEYKYYTEKWKDIDKKKPTLINTKMCCLSYEFKCNLCVLSYVGKSRQHLSERIN